MTIEDINKFKEDWAAAVKRALAAGFDVRVFLYYFNLSSKTSILQVMEQQGSLLSLDARIPRWARLPPQPVPLSSF